MGSSLKAFGYLNTNAMELGGVVDTPDGCAALQRDHSRLEKQAERHLTEFNKGNFIWPFLILMLDNELYIGEVQQGSRTGPRKTKQDESFGCHDAIS